MKTRTIQERLQQSFTRFPERTALECPGAEHPTQSYAELQQRAHSVASWLINHGIPRETFIGILMEESMDIIATMLGILAARCVFVPLEPMFPTQRLQEMIHAVNIPLVIGDQPSIQRLLDLPGQAKELPKPIIQGCGQTPAPPAPTGPDMPPLQHPIADDAVPPATSCDNAAFQAVYLHDIFAAGEKYGSPSTLFTALPYDGEDRIYVYHTSGSSGKPKAILGKNKSLAHFVDWEIETFQVNENSRISQLITPGFDAFLRDVFVPLCAGGTACIPLSRDVVLDPGRFIEWLDNSSITLIHCLPALFQLLLAGQTHAGQFPALRYILLSGERIEPALLARWYAIFGERIQLVNLYGPTETTMIKTCYFIQPGDITKERIPVGKAMKGARLFILDNDNHLCPAVVEGEIYIRTPFATHGYCNDPETTAQKFIPNPFNRKPGDLLFKTGDRGRLLPDSNIDLLGRLDRQVKIRGQRIEPAEIEAALLGHPAVTAAVVVKRVLPNHNELLCAFIVTRKHPDPGQPGQDTPTAQEDINSIRQYISGELPEYMIPARFQVIPGIPRKANGKIDYDGLPDLLEDEESSRPTAPRTPLEEKIRTIWAGILGMEAEIEKIGVTRSFFELGGNSLNVMALISKLLKEFDVRISLGEIFRHLTIEKQAEFINASMKKSELDQLLEKLECIVRLNKISSTRNLFIIHPLEPTVFLYQELAHLLEGEFNVFGVQPRGLTGKSPLPNSFEEMVYDYLWQIKRVQPQGPYHLAGYCIGCMIVYEMVRLLEDLGDTVENLIMLDARAFLSKNIVRVLRVNDRLFEVRDAPAALREKLDMPLSVLAPDTKARFAYSPQWIENRRQTIRDNNDEISRKFAPWRLIDTPVLMIKAAASEGDEFKKKNWRRMTTGSVRIVETPGDHHSIFRDENVVQLAAIIKKWVTPAPPASPAATANSNAGTEDSALSSQASAKN